MTGHIPECPHAEGDFYSDCQCERLRRCEDRVTGEKVPGRLLYQLGYEHALDQVIEALSATVGGNCMCGECMGWDRGIRNALGYISGLKEINGEN